MTTAQQPEGPLDAIPPEHVLNAFHAAASNPARSAGPEHLGYAWDNGVKIGEVVLAHASELAAWSAKVREKLDVPAARVVRPVLSTDGRFVVAGWKANQFVPGRLARRVDETAQLALRLEEVLRDIAVPHAGSAGARQDVFARAERAAWDETGEFYREWEPGPVGLGHADLLATTLFTGLNAPTIVDLVPTDAPRPAGYTAALVIVDGLIAGAVDDAVCDRFAHIPGVDQLLLRAVAYRRHVNELHPGSKANTRSHIERVEEMLVSRAAAIL